MVIFIQFSTNNLKYTIVLHLSFLHIPFVALSETMNRGFTVLNTFITTLHHVKQ
jgi:hypothetical protein